MNLNLVLVMCANDEIESMYVKYQLSNAPFPTRRLFTASSMMIRSQFTRWKQWYINYLCINTSRKINRDYNEFYFESLHDECMKILGQLEETAKYHIGEVCKDWLNFWELQQTKFGSTSAYCEPLGNKIGENVNTGYKPKGSKRD